MPLFTVPANAQADSTDLAVGIADYPDPACVLSNVTYLISVTNLGPGTATGVGVSGSLPAGVNLIYTNATQGAVSIADTALTWLVGTINSGAQATLTLIVQTTAYGMLTNSATVAGAEPDPNPANNSATATTLVAPPFVSVVAAGATLIYESGPTNGAVDPGETVTVILRLRNTGNVPNLYLVGSLLTNNGVTPYPPNNPQVYGVLLPSNASVGRSFTFTANGTNGQTISPTLQLQDSTNSFPPVSFFFTLSRPEADLTDLAVGIEAVPEPVVVGSNLTYVISVTNLGPSAATGVSVTSVLPVSDVILSATVSPPQGSVTTSGNRIVWSGVGLASGDRATVTITAIRTIEGTNVAMASVAGDQLDPVPANNTIWAATTATPGPADLAIGIADYPDPALLGSNVTYVVSVTNLGPSAATGVSVNEVLPTPVNVVSTNTTRGTISVTSGALAWSVGELSSGARATLVLVVQTTANGTLTNSATVAGVALDPNPANNSATATTLVAPPFISIVAAGATLVSESGPVNGAVDPGETVTAILRLRNVGNVITLNLVGTLLTNDGVTPLPPNNPANYGLLAPSGFPVGRTFAFTASGTNGQTITATLQLRDGTNAYPDATFSFTLPSAQCFANADVILIPDPAASPPYLFESGPAKPYPSVIGVSNLAGVITKVTVTLSNVSHAYPGDINALLVGPSGATTLLMSHAASHSVWGLDLTFDDSASGSLPAWGELVSGIYQPTAYGSIPSFPTKAPAGPYGAALSSFNGRNPNGTWSLYVFDDWAGGAGIVSGGWSLTLTTITPINPFADLGVTVADAPDPVSVGSPVTYTFTITNSGFNAATSVAFTNVVPTEVALVSATSSQGIVLMNSNTVVANLGTVNAGAVATVTAVVIPTCAALPPGASSVILTNTASVRGNEMDYILENNSAETTTTVLLPVADVGMSLSGAPEPVVIGFHLTNTISVANLGPGTALGVVVTDPLPAGAELVSASTTVGTCTNLGGTVACSLGDLTANSRATVTLVFANSLLGSITNIVSVATCSQDTNSANNSAKYVSTVTSPAPNIIAAGALLTAESGPVNGRIDPAERVALDLFLANVGSLDTVNLKASLEPSGGVTSPSGPQYYGAVIYGGPSAGRSFTFTAAAVGNAVVATLELQDERPTVTNSLGTVTFTFDKPIATAYAWLSGSMVSGQFRLVVAAQPGYVYAIQASTNLSSWVSLSTNTASTGGTIVFTDTDYPSFEQRFYRTVRLSP